MSKHLTWHEEQREREQFAEQCATALAEHLSGDWARCDPHEHVVAIRSGDRRLTIRPERKATVWRVVITAHLPEGYDARTRLEPQETTVAADRPASQIAGQVARRLLTPEYDAAIAEVHAALAAERDRKAAMVVALAEIEALIPGAGPTPHDSEGYTRFSGPGSWRGSFRVLSSSGEIDIDLERVPADLAGDIAALIGKHLGADGAGRLRELSTAEFPHRPIRIPGRSAPCWSALPVPESTNGVHCHVSPPFRRRRDRQGPPELPRSTHPLRLTAVRLAVLLPRPDHQPVRR